MSIAIQKRHPYTGNVNSETSGDSKNAFLHCGDVLGHERQEGLGLQDQGRDPEPCLLKPDLCVLPKPANFLVAGFCASQCSEADCH